MHTSLDSALGRQRRLNQVGESITQIAPDPAAAYSLRSLTGSDPKVVRVRRGSDNHEQDFTASEVSAGALTSFVNAQVVAPLDIQALEADGRTGDFLIAKAAYSLRSLGTRQATLAATGDTVARADGKFVAQVRRSSDDALKSFTAAEVSDGTLVAFVNDILTVTTAINGTGSFDSYTVTNASTTGFSADNSAGGTGSAGFPYSFGNGDVIVIKYTVTNFSDTSDLSPQVRGVTATSSVVPVTSLGSVIRANGTYTDTLTASADGTHLMYADGGTGSYTISDFEIVSHASNGFVKTWYDQSVTNEAGDTATGNHATQATAASQPKIVDGGALVSGGIDFDGTANRLDIDFGSNLSQPNSIFMVHQSSRVDAKNDFFDELGTTGQRTLLDQSGANYRMFAGSSADSGLSIDTNKNLITAIYNGASSILAKNGTASSAINAGTQGISSTSAIGFSEGTTAYYQGSMQEFIIYNSDQSDNRTAIEANIGEVYSIDLPSGVDPGFDQVDGFVETWYDQSGNGRDATQATAGRQPKIVDGGALVTSGGLPAIDNYLSNSGIMLETGLTGLQNTNYSHFAVFNTASTEGTGMLLGMLTPNPYVGAIQNGSSLDAQSSQVTNIPSYYKNGALLVAPNRGALHTAFHSSEVVLSSIELLTTSDTLWLNDFGILTYKSDALVFSAKTLVSEWIIYDSDQSANRPALETNIASEYGITLS